MRPRTFLCKSHPDFHMPADVDVGIGFDGFTYAKRLKECGADAVAIFAKCHYGHSYYDTKVGVRHPRLHKDMLAEVVRGCRANDVGIVAYFSVFLDTAAVTKHPEWRLKATRATTDAGFDSGNYLPVCVNSGYGRESLIPQSVEVARNYDVDELFYDTMTGFQPCYCDACVKLFGAPVPSSDQGDEWLRYVRWYRSCYDNFFAEVAAAVHAARADLTVAFNWEWGVRRPNDPPAHITRLSADLIPTGTVASNLCHYFAGTGYPFDYMCGRFLHGLGDWNNAPSETIKYTAAATVANGGSFYIIDRQLPDGRLEERGWSMMKDVFGYVQARRDVLEGTVHAPETAVLLSHDHLMGDKLQYFPDSDARRKRAEAFEGVSRMFMHHGRHYTALSTTTLQRRVREYRLVIVPEVEYLDSGVVATLRSYVKEGGTLLVTQSETTAGLCPELFELAGVRHEGFSALEYGYWDAGSAEPLAARGRFSDVKPVDGAEEIVRRICPLKAGKGGAAFGHGLAPADRYEGFAMATCRTVGKGRIVYLAMPAFAQYWQNQNPYLAQLVFSLVDRLLPDPMVRVSTGAQVEMTTMRKGRDLIVHLVNHSGRERLLGYWYPLTEYVPEIRGIEIQIRVGTRSPVASFEPKGTRIKYRRQNGYACFKVPRLHFMESIRIKGYFTGGTRTARGAR